MVVVTPHVGHESISTMACHDSVKLLEPATIVECQSSCVTIVRIFLDFETRCQ